MPTPREIDAAIRKTGLFEISEEAFMQQIIQLARTLGYRCYHTRDSRKCEAGFPDLVIGKPGRVIVVETKSRKGRLTVDQQWWLGVFESCDIEQYVWKPADWDEIVKILQQKSPYAGKGAGVV